MQQFLLANRLRGPWFKEDSFIKHSSSQHKAPDKGSWKKILNGIKGTVSFPINSTIHVGFFAGNSQISATALSHCTPSELQCRSIAAFTLLHNHFLAPSRMKNNTCSDSAPLSLNVWEFFCNYK